MGIASAILAIIAVFLLDHFFYITLVLAIIGFILGILDLIFKLKKEIISSVAIFGMVFSFIVIAIIIRNSMWGFYMVINWFS